MNEARTIESKKSISSSFGKSAVYYDRNASIQKEVAERMIASLRPWTEILPPGPILEIGCGTGFVTKDLLDLLPEREFLITDISPEMVRYCGKKFGDNDRIQYKPLDAESMDVEPESYAMTIGGFVAQWLKHPAISLGKCLEATKPGGLLLTSFPGNESFPEWKEACRELGLPFTGNELPDTEEMVIKLSGGPVQLDYYEDTIRQKFKSAVDFFRHLKRLGAGVQQKGRHLSTKEMRMLINHWNEKTGGDITVSHHIVFIAVKRNIDL